MSDQINKGTQNFQHDEARGQSSHHADKLPAKSRGETVPRRALFSLGLLSTITQACSNAEFASGVAGVKTAGKASNSEGAKPTGVNSPEEQKARQSETPPSPTDANCSAVSNPSIDIPPNIPEKAVTAAFYGRQDSALLALMLPAGEDVKQVVISTAKGKLMALHGITGADKNSNGTWRPIVIDSLPLIDQGNALNEVVVLLQLGNGRAKAVLPVNFMTKFQTKSVVDLSGRTVPSVMIGAQSVAQFAEVDARTGGFGVNANLVYPNTYNTDKVRNLYTAKPTSTWTIGAGLIGTITDIMGNVIDRTKFSILDHQVFCTYVDIGGGKVARTMIHVG